VFGPLPSFQTNIANLESERRRQADINLWYLQSELHRDVRYPYLDRTFLEFVYAIPREQIVRAGQRRALMKRALVGIVPDEILKRRRIALAEQPSRTGFPAEWLSLIEICDHMVSSVLGVVDANRFGEALQKAGDDNDSLSNLLRTLTLESWLQHLKSQRVLTNATSQREPGYGPVQAREAHAGIRPNIC
jgi:asparagine synthetase B (glutamine-hydrolysing)